MRTIIIEVQTDADYDLNFIEEDLKQEIRCCSTWFDTDTLKIKEANEKRG